MTRTYLRPLAFYGAPLPINEPQLCKEYSLRVQTLPPRLTSEELKPSLALLLNYPYLSALSNLTTTIFSPGKRLSSEAVSKIEKMIGDMQAINPFTKAASQKLEEGLYFEIVPQGMAYHALLDKMNQIPNCIASENKEQVASRIQQDIDLGACIKFFGQDGQGVPRSYFRNYLTISKNRDVLMQIDTTEAGSSSYWTKLQEWVQAGRGKEFLFGIAASMYIADRLGISQLVLGEFESDEIGKMIGCRRVRIYDSKVSARKIGLVPRLENEDGETITDGVFVNRLAKDSVQRILDLGLRRIDRDALFRSEIMEDGFGSQYDSHKKKEVELTRIILENLKHIRGE